MIYGFCNEDIEYVKNTSGSRCKNVDEIYDWIYMGAKELGMDEVIDISDYNKLNIPVYTVKKNGALYHTNYGKGITISQAKISALMEFIERMSAEKSGTTNIWGTYDELTKKVPYEIVNPSNMITLYTNYVSETLRINWIPVFNISKMAIAFLPTIGVLFPYYEDEEILFNNNTNGIAAGSNFHEAIIQGAYEVIERDIISIGLATGKYKNVKKESISDETINEILAEFSKQNIDVSVKYIVNEFDIPCFIACCNDEYAKGIYGGYGCHTSKTVALVRALTELAQSIKSLSYSGDEIQLIKRESTIKETIWNVVKEEIGFDEINSTVFSDMNEETEYIINLLLEKNMHIYVANLTAYDTSASVPVVRVIIPGMENWYDTRNRIGRRLYNEMQKC